MTTKITFQEPKAGSIIEYRYNYSLKDTVVGLVIKIEDDVNFYKIIHCLTNTKEIELLPLSTIEYKIIKL